jgi:cell division protein FtsB
MTDTLERSIERPDPPKRKRRSRVRRMVFVALLVSLGFVATGVLPVQQFLERNNQVTVAQERLDALVEENTILADNAQALLTDEEIERVAREQYGFVQPGEIGYVVITPDTPTVGSADAQPTDATASGQQHRGFLQRIWDFVTGRDVASDG